MFVKKWMADIFRSSSDGLSGLKDMDVLKRHLTHQHILEHLLINIGREGLYERIVEDNTPISIFKDNIFNSPALQLLSDVTNRNTAVKNIIIDSYSDTTQPTSSEGIDIEKEIEFELDEDTLYVIFNGNAMGVAIYGARNNPVEKYLIRNIVDFGIKEKKSDFYTTKVFDSYLRSGIN